MSGSDETERHPAEEEVDVQTAPPGATSQGGTGEMVVFRRRPTGPVVAQPTTPTSNSPAGPDSA